MKHTRGFSLVELMIALLIGLIVVAGLISVFVAEHSVYRTASAQAAIQNAENGISFIVTPVLRAAGFAGCGNLTQAVPLVVPAATPLPYNLAVPVMGFDAVGTAGSGTYVLASLNPANDGNATHWSPALDATLLNRVEQGSDVVATVGQLLGTAPVGVTSIIAGAATFVIGANTNPPILVGQIAAVSNCGNGSSFRVTDVTGNTIGHAAGLNISGTFNPDYTGPGPGIDLRPQFVPLQQTVFFVGKGDGGQSALWQATLDGVVAAPSSSGWTFQEIVPGVDNMQVLYGIGPGGVNQQYVAASAVIDWTAVNSIRLGFLVEGPIGSSPSATTFSVLGTTVTVPADTRLRHVYVMTVDLRNTTP